MIEGLPERLNKYFKDRPEPCTIDDRQAMCRYASTHEEGGDSHNFDIEETVLTESEGEITRYDITEILGFWGGGTIIASIEQGEVVEGGELNSAGTIYARSQSQKENNVLGMIDEFERRMEEKERRRQ